MGTEWIQNLASFFDGNEIDSNCVSASDKPGQAIASVGCPRRQKLAFNKKIDVTTPLADCRFSTHPSTLSHTPKTLN
eukprot:scaffold2029_cov253-Chaetoceros_neogracile.AAC.1